MYADDEYLALSGIQHFWFCRRQWALIHIERMWKENLLTAEGRVMHGRAHDELLKERRGDVLVVRGLTVRSESMGVLGQCDVVEFHQVTHGHPLFGENGLWAEMPVEYKHGRSKPTDEDRVQLCAQALCLEEMFASSIPYACLYYGETHSRERVELTDGLREDVRRGFEEMHSIFEKRYVPKAKRSKKCRSCSLKDLCMPKAKSVDDYIRDSLEGMV